MTQTSTNKELQGSNRLVSTCLTIECSIIIVAYIAEYLKQARTLSYVLLTCLLCASLPVSCWITFSKKRDNGLIKHILGLGFPVFYGFVLFTSENTLTFTYAIPILIIASAYADSKFSLMESIGFFVFNVIQLIQFFSKGIYNSTNTAYMEIHILIVLLIATFSYFSARRVEINNKERENRINNEMSRTKELLNHIVAISKETNTNIDLVCNDISELEASIKSTSKAMKNVDDGAANTTATVQEQMSHTDNISAKIESVSTNYHEIVKNITEALTTIQESKGTINELTQKSSETIEKGNDVTKKLNDLDAIMLNMNTAVDIISDITSQTSLLSLNASIEAARAGEAGRGFSVVASEIQKMANDTQGAATKIQKMVEDVTSAISEVVHVTSDMIEQILNQGETTKATVNNFEKIENNTESIKACASEMSQAVDQLDEANQEIVDSISRISKISEDVSVNANATLTSCEDNIQTVENLISAMGKLSNLASSLLNQ